MNETEQKAKEIAGWITANLNQLFHIKIPGRIRHLIEDRITKEFSPEKTKKRKRRSPKKEKP